MKMIYSKVLTLVMGVIVNQNGFSSSSKTQNSQTLPQNEDTTNHLTREKVIELQRQQNHPDVFIVPDDIEVIDSQAFNKESSHQDDEQSSISNINHIIIDQSQSNNEKLTIKPQAFLGNFNKITFRDCKNLTIAKNAFSSRRLRLSSNVNQIELSNCKFSKNNKGFHFTASPIDIIVDQMERLPDDFCAFCKIKNLTFTKVIKTLGSNCFNTCRLPDDFPLGDSNKLSLSFIPKYAFYSCCWFSDNGGMQNIKSINFHIPDTWECIGGCAFAFSDLFQSLEDGKNLIRVGEEAFGCTVPLKYICLSGATHFDDRAFTICDGLKSVVFGEGSTFGTGIFSDCCHEFVIELPDAVTFSDLERITEGLTSDRAGYKGPIILCPNVDKVTEA